MRQRMILGLVLKLRIAFLLLVDGIAGTPKAARADDQSCLCNDPDHCGAYPYLRYCCHFNSGGGPGPPRGLARPYSLRHSVTLKMPRSDRSAARSLPAVPERVRAIPRVAPCTSWHLCETSSPASVTTQLWHCSLARFRFPVSMVTDDQDGNATCFGRSHAHREVASCERLERWAGSLRNPGSVHFNPVRGVRGDELRVRAESELPTVR